MNKKKMIGLISAGVAAVMISGGAGLAIGYNHNTNQQAVQHEQKNITQSSNNTVSNTDATAQSETNDFDSLSQKEQLALLINHYFDDESELNTTYRPYMGAANHIVMTWDGMDDILDRAFLVNDNHDGTFTFLEVEDSDDDLANRESQTNYWEPTDTVSKTTLFAEYAANQTTIASLVAKLDMAKASEEFTELPVKNTMPVGSSVDDDHDDDNDYDD